MTPSCVVGIAYIDAVQELQNEFRVSELQNEFRLGWVLLLRLGLSSDTRNSIVLEFRHSELEPQRKRTIRYIFTCFYLYLYNLFCCILLYKSSTVFCLRFRLCVHPCSFQIHISVTEIIQIRCLCLRAAIDTKTYKIK